MPQRRKNPFSGKAKKLQLQAKKGSRRPPLLLSPGGSTSESGDGQTIPTKAAPGRYALKFKREGEREIRERKEAAQHALQPQNQSGLELRSEDFFPDGVSFPVRPPWDYKSTPQELEMIEQRYFTNYMNEIEAKFKDNALSHFEENLETWRQLWRVLEMSDILLYIVDVRFSNAIFPPSVYDYVSNVKKKDMILLLNKIDLAPPGVVAAWIAFFKERYPQLNIVLFTSVPGYNLRSGRREGNTGLQMRRRKGKPKMAAEGALNLQRTCQEIVGEAVDLTSWKNKIDEEMNSDRVDEERTVEECIIKKNDTNFYVHEKYKDGVLSIGCLGQPNVGKSSVMNALMGKKVVSVSKSPGHTKHFQTIFLTKNVRLVDCPGLVFPSRVPKPLQVLMGSFPIAQLREPYTAIRFLAERVDLVKLLGITHPDKDSQWSPIDVCDGWAARRGFFTAKAARPDSYRAANSILRMALDGTVPFSFRPPGYSAEAARWESEQETMAVKWVLAASTEETTYRREGSKDSGDESDITSSSSSESDASVKDNSDDPRDDPGNERLGFSNVKNRYANLELDSD